MTRVTSAEFQKNFGLYKRAALSEPLVVSIHGKETLVVMSHEHYESLLAGVKEKAREILALPAPPARPEIDAADEIDEIMSEEEMGRLQDLLSRSSPVLFQDAANRKD